jgi:predicted RND superfamily exporter protein/outer membrane lipoprotein-sorting protein
MEEKKLKTYLEWIIRHRKLVMALMGIFTLGLMTQLRSLQIVIDPDDVLPQTHPYVQTGRLIETVFGNKFTAVIGITAREGNIYQTALLEKVARITQRIAQHPDSIKSSIISLSAQKAKDIAGTRDGMTVNPLMETVPATPKDLAKLQAAVERMSLYENLLVSKDKRSTQIVAEFRQGPGGFIGMSKAVRDAVAPEMDASVDIRVSGMPIFLGLFEKYSSRMAFLFPLALLIIGLIHYEAFRTLQALILPLVTALLAVLWALGILGLLRQPFDVFNSATPILILAIAAGHAVQILKRYYEEYAVLYRQNPQADLGELNRKAVLLSLSKVGPVMLVAGAVAALGFFSLVIFDIKSIRTFGIFTGAGVLSALLLELTFIPSLRAMLKPPSRQELMREQAETAWDRLTGLFFHWAYFKRKKVYVLFGLILAVLSVGGFWLRVENSQKDYFLSSLPERKDSDVLNERMAGTNPLFFLVSGANEDAIKRPEVLQAMERLQRKIEESPFVGKTVSLADFVKTMNRSMHADKAPFFTVPASQDLVAQYLFLYSNSGSPGDFDSYVDNGYQRAVIAVFMKSDRSIEIDQLVNSALAFAKADFPAGVSVGVGGGVSNDLALNKIMIHEKVLNILQIMGAVFLLSALVFRSVAAGLLVLVPLVAAVAANFGVMGLLGIPLNIASALVSAMAVGIGADYGIYMSFRMQEELATGGTEEGALARAFQSAGKAVLFVSTAVAGGFGVLILSWGFRMHVWMGFLIATAMLVSSITALTLFPALVFSFRPRFIFGGRKAARPSGSSKTMLLSLLLPAFLTLWPATAPAADLSAAEIAKRNFQASKFNDSTATATFRLINASGQERVRTSTGASKLLPGTTDAQRMITFLSPADVKGTRTWVIEHSHGNDDMWIYLPAMKKVRRLVASNKRDAYAGTDFSYGDVLGHRPEDWDHKLIGGERLDGRDCYVIESSPVRAEVGKNSGYSKRVSWIDKESFIAVKAEAYDLGAQLSRRFFARDIQKVDPKNDKWQPMVMEADDLQSGHRTIIEFKNFRVNVGIPDSLFSSKNLESR